MHYKIKEFLTYAITFGCLRLFNKAISLSAVHGIPSSSFSRFIFLIATVYNLQEFIYDIVLTSHNFVSNALYTTP